MLIAIAGPFSAETEAERNKNLKLLNLAAAEVYRKGHIPVIGVNAALPVSDELSNLPRREVINNISFAIIEKCDAILMTGSSPGADFERDIIASKGLPVYYTVNEIPLNDSYME